MKFKKKNEKGTRLEIFSQKLAHLMLTSKSTELLFVKRKREEKKKKKERKINNRKQAQP